MDGKLLQRHAEEKGGYAIDWRRPWEYASPAKIWMERLQRLWDPHALFATLGFAPQELG
ncbi:MAG: hypothetical protein ANABAC_2159 [Anaerolineae bacterium]|nr:MAG: hypothetical protein ANABAC_2159 [Anaerolineae bacterium]